MEKNKICWARVSKNICYFLAPVFALVLIACVAGLIIMDSDVELKDTTNYFDSKLFSSSYLDSVRSNMYIPSNYIQINEDEEEQAINYYGYNYDIQENVNINGKKGNIIYTTNEISNFKYLIIDVENLVAKTNLEHTMYTDSIEKIKDVISQNSIYWNSKYGEIDTSISHLSIEEIKYKSEYQYINSSEIQEIYTSLTDGLLYKDDYAMAKLAYDLSMKANTLAPILIPICIAVLLALGLVVLNGIGKKAKAEGIHLNGFDKLPLEIAFLIGIFIMGVGAFCFVALNSNIRAIIFTGLLVGFIIAYLGAMLLLETFIKRLKTHTLLKSTIVYKFCHGIKTLIDHRKITTKLILFYGGFCILGGILL